MEIAIATGQDAAEWDRIVDESSHGTIFHTWRWLKIVEKHTGTALYPLMCHKGTTLVAIYPIFVLKKGFATVALSPPSRAYLLYLGPVIVDYDTLKQDKKESVFIAVQEEVDRFLFSELGCNVVRIRSSPRLPDSRPFRWAGYSVEPLYTYRVNLTQGAGHVWEQFDRKLRVDIKKTEREDVVVEEGGLEDLRYMYSSLASRMTEQGLSTTGSMEYLADLYETFHPSNMKIYAAIYQGERVGGMVSLCYKDGMHLWIGVPKSDVKGISPNDLVQWQAISWACDNGFKYYELMDAGDNPRLRTFKSKYNPDLAIWYSAAKYSSYQYKLIAHALKRV